MRACVPVRLCVFVFVCVCEGTLFKVELKDNHHLGGTRTPILTHTHTPAHLQHNVRKAFLFAHPTVDGQNPLRASGWVLHPVSIGVHPFQKGAWLCSSWMHSGYTRMLNYAAVSVSIMVPSGFSPLSVEGTLVRLV